MSTLGLILLFTILSGVLSMIGGVVLLGKPDLVKKFSIHFVSFAVGALLAIVFLDLFPEAIELAEGRSSGVFVAALVSIIVFFLIERLVLRFHAHHHEDDERHNHATPTLLLIGDGIHNFVDGIAVAAAFLVSPPLGVATALAVAIHELPQEISDFSIMLNHGWRRSKVLWANFAVSLTSVAGALVAFAARDFIEPYLPMVLAVTAGIFIYIAMSDLLPEISPKTSRDKFWHVFILMLLGVAAVWLAGQVSFG